MKQSCTKIHINVSVHSTNKDLMCTACMQWIFLVLVSQIVSRTFRVCKSVLILWNKSVLHFYPFYYNQYYSPLPGFQSILQLLYLIYDLLILSRSIRNTWIAVKQHRRAFSRRYWFVVLQCAICATRWVDPFVFEYFRAFCNSTGRCARDVGRLGSTRRWGVHISQANGQSVTNIWCSTATVDHLPGSSDVHVQLERCAYGWRLLLSIVGEGEGS